MKSIIDIHCHIIPGVDDGASDSRETRKILEIAYKEGVRVMCATPHYQPERWPVTGQAVEEAYETVKKEASQVALDFQILLGNELYYRSHSRQALAEGNCHTLGNSRYVLVEFNPLKEFQYINQSLYELMAEGYTPLLAHVERYQCLKKNLSRLEGLLNQGVCMQMNAGSLTGDLGFSETRYAKKLISEGYIQVIASDAHNTGRRAPRFEKCRSYLAKTYGEEYAEELLHDNPLRILQDKEL